MNFNIPNIYIAKNISYLRKKRKMTQEQLGECLGKDYSSIGKWEKNVNQPSITDTFKLATLFDVDWREFVLTDLSISDNQYDEEIKNIATKNGVKIVIDKNAPLTAESVVEVNKILMEELDKENKK